MAAAGPQPEGRSALSAADPSAAGSSGSCGSCQGSVAYLSIFAVLVHAERDLSRAAAALHACGLDHPGEPAHCAVPPSAPATRAWPIGARASLPSRRRATTLRNNRERTTTEHQLLVPERQVKRTPSTPTKRSRTTLDRVSLTAQLSRSVTFRRQSPPNTPSPTQSLRQWTAQHGTAVGTAGQSLMHGRMAMPSDKATLSRTHRPQPQKTTCILFGYPSLSRFCWQANFIIAGGPHIRTRVDSFGP